MVQERIMTRKEALIKMRNDAFEALLSLEVDSSIKQRVALRIAADVENHTKLMQAIDKNRMTMAAQEEGIRIIDELIADEDKKPANPIQTPRFNVLK